MRQLFAERLEPLAATGATVRVSLMSQMERNLSLYLRQGFVVIDDERLTSEEDETMDIPNWVMIKRVSVASGAAEVATPGASL